MEQEIQPSEQVSQFEDFEKKSIKIYSKKAIWGFSVLVTPFVGGALLSQYLRDIEKRKEANYILASSILYTLLVLIIVNLQAKPMGSLTFGLNAVGGGILTEHFFKKNFPDEEAYDKKPIWIPLIISAVICIGIFMLIIYGN